MVQFPQAFLDLIEQEIPAHLNLEDFKRYSQMPLRRSIRVNTLKITVAEFVEKMTAKGWRLQPIPWCKQGFWLEGEQDDKALGNTPEHLAGLFYVQEASSMLPPTALFHFAGAPNEVLDVASAPGSKTSQIAALMNNQGLLIANEYSSSRVKVLHANMQRLGVRNVALTHFDGHVFGPTLPETFDAILLDAPCGGEGTVRKDPDALKNWSQQAVDAISEVQNGLIESAFAALKVGGTLVYSTCTLNQQENQQVCLGLQQRHPSAVEFLSLEALFPDASKSVDENGFLHVWPQTYDSEGFFIAAIRKTAPVETTYVRPRLGKFPFKPAKAEQCQAIEEYFNQQLGLTIPEQGTVMIRDAELWWFPQPLMKYLDKIRLQRLGVKLADIHKKGFRTHYQAVTCLPLDSSKAIALSLEQAEQYLMGRDIQHIESGSGEVVVTYLGTALGTAKRIKTKLKNGLPRELVRDKIAHY